jgi:hypothetical protein
LLRDVLDVHPVDHGIDPELVDEGLPHDLGVVAGPEGRREAGGRDAERESAPVEPHDLGVLGDESPGEAPHREDPTEHRRPSATDGIGVETARGCWMTGVHPRHLWCSLARRRR